MKGEDLLKRSTLFKRGGGWIISKSLKLPLPEKESIRLTSFQSGKEFQDCQIV